MSGILKRRFVEVDVGDVSPCLSLRGSDDEVSAGSDSGNGSDSVNPGPSTPLASSSISRREKRRRVRNVHFESVTVYYFGRRQGFTSVPTQGGSTLGMSTRHSWVKHYTLGEFAMEQERNHRDMLRDHLKEEKLNSIRLKLTKNGTVESDEAESLTLDDISEDDIDLDNTEVDEYFFLQPLTTRRRSALLRASGVRRIDVEEKHELRAIRVSREECGCDCRGLCHPATCACSLAGIKCQVNGAEVDRMSFPCGCSRGGCSNTAGRIEFNPVRVRTHFLHTVMKLELEKNLEQQPQVVNGNGYRVDLPVDAPVQHAAQYPLTSDASPVPPAPIMHMLSAGSAEHLLEEEEEEEEEEDEDEEDEEEYEEEDDGSSLCSGLSDCSTHSLNTSDSEEEESDEEDWESTEEGGGPSNSHTDQAPLSSVLGYPDGQHPSPNCTNSYYHVPSSRSYRSPTTIPTRVPSEPPSALSALPPREKTTDGPVIGSQDGPATTSEPRVDNLRQAEGLYLGTNLYFPHNALEAHTCSSVLQQGNTAPSGETDKPHHKLPFRTDVNSDDVTLSLNSSAHSEVSDGTEAQQSSPLPVDEMDAPALESHPGVTA
ncbi:cysteine/serine-rich nuclear protein 3 isoform X1 [Esox lucius]|uniref:Cysteine/serine-rich nuclear protein N-terminal domain-containing protein n=1 Tax=Esox lucius TaxID=8010 RepID=A0AAY5JXC7_ESOLU|nr:cysteine/serine-rich nuclear protein 3 isoform X1 [Esox lucius]XP_010884917.2 cysteine/serine-rich nuclear protein 3 isoform X1 [Esox lucius]XP_019897842.2 cysteine/serine-rich nuclear protein 3 isoform X1 [Esox lucius]